MVAFLYRMPAGIPGDVTRPSNSTTEPQQIDAAAPPTKYGVFVKLVSGKVRPIAASDAATVVYGLLQRPYPTNAANEALGAATPPTSGLCNVVVRGYMTVKLAFGTAAKNGQVYVTTVAGGAAAVGDIATSATPDTGATAVAVAGCIFMGAADASGNVEIRFNI